MGEILHFLSLIIAPLASSLFAVVLIAGFIFGVVYIYRLNVSNEDIFHIAMAGWVFMFTIFVYRVATYLAEGTIITQAAGWLGIGLGWGLYCGFIALGSIALKRYIRHRSR